MRHLILLALLCLFATLSAQEHPPIYLSADQGNEWQPFCEGLPSDAAVRGLSEDQGRVYLTTSNYGVFSLAPDASTWEAKANVGLPYGTDFFLTTGFYIMGDTLILGTWAHGTYYSHDQGNSWAKSVADVPTFVRCLLNTPWGLLAGTESGIWQTKDNGQHWQKFNDHDDDGYIINSLTMHKGALVVASQNGLGRFDGVAINWSPVISETAILQMMSDGESVYAFNYMDELFHSQDGINWTLGPIQTENPSCDHLTDAIVQGYWPEVPSPHFIDIIHATSYGWIGMGGIGCRVPEE